MFGDIAVLPLIMFVFILCILIHRFAVIVGGILGIWKINRALDGNPNAEATGGKDDLMILLEQITAFQNEEFQG